MKRIVAILAFFLLLAIQPPAPAQENPSRSQETSTTQTVPPANDRPEKSRDSEEDSLSYSAEQEILPREYFRKRLPPLSNREKLIWSFRTAKANILL